MKKGVVILILFFLFRSLYPQNSFEFYKRAFYGFSPFFELNNEEDLNKTNKKIKQIAEYLSASILVFDTISLNYCMSDSLNKKFFYKAKTYEFDDLHNLISYNAFDERGKIILSVTKKYFPDSIVRVIQNHTGNVSLTDIYKLNNNKLPELLSDSLGNILCKYYYNETGKLSKVEVFRKDKTTDKYEYTYDEINNNLMSLTRKLNGDIENIYLYVENNNVLQIKSYNPASHAIINNQLFTYNSKNQIIKEILISESNNIETYSNDKTYLYKNGLLIKELFYNGTQDMMVTEFFYYPNNDLKMKFTYYEKNRDRILGCVKYEYSYYD